MTSLERSNSSSTLPQPYLSFLMQMLVNGSFFLHTNFTKVDGAKTVTAVQSVSTIIRLMNYSLSHWQLKGDSNAPK